MLAVGDADDLAAGLGVGLGATQVQQQAVGFGFEVGEGECGELGAAQRASEPKQDDGGVAGPAHGVAVDGGDDLPQVGDAQRPGGSARRGSEEAAQSATYLSDCVVVDRVGQPVAAVLVPDGRARGVDGGQGGFPVGAVGEVGADSGRLGRELVIPRSWHQLSHWLQAKAYTFRVVSA